MTTTMERKQQIQIKALQEENKNLAKSNKTWVKAFEELSSLTTMEVPAIQSPIEPMGVSKWEATAQQEKQLRVKAEKALEEMKEEFNRVVTNNEDLKMKWANEVSNSMKKDEQIEDMQGTIDILNAKLAAAETANKELETRLKDGLIKYRELQDSLALQRTQGKTNEQRKEENKQKQQNIKAQINEKPASPKSAPTDIDAVIDYSIGHTVKDYIHPGASYHLCVKAVKNCANCPIVDKCKSITSTNAKGETISFCEGSKISRDCNLMATKRSVYQAGTRLGINVDVENGRYVTNIFDENGLYIGVVRENKENAPILDALRTRDNRGKTIVVQTTPTKNMHDKDSKTSIFTSLHCEVLEIVERGAFPPAPKAPVTDKVEEVVDPQTEVESVNDSASVVSADEEFAASADSLIINDEELDSLLPGAQSSEQDADDSAMQTETFTADQIPDEDEDEEMPFDQNTKQGVDAKVAAMFLGA